MKFRIRFAIATTVFCWMLWGLTQTARAETVYYSLENVILEDGEQMTGLFSWTYEIGDFENGDGEFITLDIPRHNENDLGISFNIESSIEIGLTNNLDSDGVDITLVLDQPLTPTTSSLLTLGVGESKYDIGGDGFYKGFFISGSISPTNTTLSMVPDATDFTLSWGPELPGFVLQETSNLSSNWVDSSSGSNNPVVIPATAPSMFYRVAKP